MKYDSAKAAALLRKQLKSVGLDVSVKSRKYAGGSSVDIYLTDASPAIVEQVERLAAFYKYGDFDALSDCYRHTNRNYNLPQVTYVFVNNGKSEMMRAKLEAAAAEYFTHPDDISHDVETLKHRLFTGVIGNFWKKAA